jgi:hypothetical protein
MPPVYVYSPSLTGTIVFRDSSIFDVMTAIRGWRRSGPTVFTRGNPDDGVKAAVLVDFGQLAEVTVMVDEPPASPEVPVWEADTSF